MYKRTLKSWLKHLDFILWDEFSLFHGLMVFLYMGMQADPPFNDPNPIALVIQILGMNLFALIALDSLKNVLRRGYLVEMRITVRHVFALLALFTLASVIRNAAYYPRWALATGFSTYAALSYLTRFFWKIFLRSNVVQREPDRSIVIVTDSDSAERVLRRMKDNSLGRYNVHGFVLINKDAKGETIGGVPVVANLSDAADYLCRSWTDEVFFFRSSSDRRTRELVERCTEMSLTMHFFLGLKGVDERKQAIETVAGYDVVTVYVNQMSPYHAFLKRTFDIAAGLAGSLATLLILAVVGPLIKKESPGPLLFRQTRIGENGKRFTMYKIRSMYVDAEARKAEYAKVNSHADGMLFKMDFDPRVIGNKALPDGTRKTGIGQLIRKTSLDEFPQFFNVLKGEMSVVGTRPPTVDEWEKYQYHHRARMAVRPGLTGLWQVDPRKDSMSFDEVVKLDTEYITGWTIGKDVRIIGKTVLSMIHGVKEARVEDKPAKAEGE